MKSDAHDASTVPRCLTRSRADSGVAPFDTERLAATCAKRDVHTLELFGSAVPGDVRGDDTLDSDVDLLVEFEGEKRLCDLVQLERDLESFLGRVGVGWSQPEPVASAVPSGGFLPSPPRAHVRIGWLLFASSRWGRIRPGSDERSRPRRTARAAPVAVDPGLCPLDALPIGYRGGAGRTS